MPLRQPRLERILEPNPYEQARSLDEMEVLPRFRWNSDTFDGEIRLVGKRGEAVPGISRG